MLNVTYGVFWLQRKGYAKITSLAEYNGTVDKEQGPQGLFSFTICKRVNKNVLIKVNFKFMGKFFQLSLQELFV